MITPTVSESSRIGRTTTLLIGAAALVIVIGGMRAASGLVGPIMLAVALTVAFHPLRARLQQYIPPWAASTVLTVAAYVLIVAMSLSLVVSIGRLAVLVPTYAPDIDDMVVSVGEWLAKRGVGDAQVDAIIGAVDIGQLVGFTTSLLAGMLGLATNLFFIISLLLFMAFDSVAANRLAEDARIHRPHFVDAMYSFARGTRSYLSVSAAFGLIVAVIDVVILYAMGIPGAFVWGVLAFVTNFIPNIGFVIGVIPPALIGLFEGGPGLMFAVIIVYSVVNLLIQSIIQPRYVGNAVGLSTTLTFLSLVFWAWVLGPLGALLAVPMSLLVKALMVEANPASLWLVPLISGHPEEPPSPAAT
jgi:AI-2 transport protein TqsA